MDHRDPDNSARHYTRYRFHRIGNSSGQVCGHVFTRNGGWWQNQCRQPSEDHWSEHSPRWRHPHPAEAGQTSRKMAMLLGCWPRFKDGYFLGRWCSKMGKLACASLSSLDRSTTRRNVDRTYREKVERKEGEEILLLPSYSLAAYVALSKCLPLGGWRPER